MQWCIQTHPQTPPKKKTFENGASPLQSLENFKFYFGQFFVNSPEIVIFQEKLKSENAEIAQIFITSLYSLLKIFWYIMSYDCPMLFCIKVSICEPISIRYTLESLIPYGKTAKSWKNYPIFLKNFLRILQKIMFFLWRLRLIIISH